MSGKLTDYQKIEIVEKYLTGKYNCAQLAREYNILTCSINSLLRNRGIIINNNKSQLKRKYTLNEHYFDIIDTEDKAYFLGLLYADGCNHEKRGLITLGLQEADKQILADFSEQINSNKPLIFINLQKNNINHNNVYRIDISSRHMSQQLSKLGCVPRKSLVLKFPTEEQVPSYLIQHFIRGYIDGDGCYSIGNGNTCPLGRIRLISTLDFCNTLTKLLINKFNIHCSIYKDKRYKNNITRELTIAKYVDVKNILIWIYKDAKFYLERKYKKAKSIMNLKDV